MSAIPSPSSQRESEAAQGERERERAQGEGERVPPGPIAPVARLPRKKQGSFAYDREKGGFVHEWKDLAEFDAWRRQEEIAHSIELILSRTGSGKEFKQKRWYKCSREPSGGDKLYQKKHPERIRKRETKKSGCSCQITIKIYYDTSTILGQYDPHHDHPVGVENIACMRMSHAARNEIYQMLSQQIDRKEIVCTVSKS
jgi:hypothetical protein